MLFQSDLPTKTSDYAIRTATAEDRPALFEFTKSFFYTAEPLNEAYNRSVNKPLSHKYEDNPMVYLPDGLSLMAVTPSGEIIGVALNAEVKPEAHLYQANENPGLDSIHKLMSIVEAKITELSKPVENKVKEIEVRVVTIHANWRNKGIGRVLLEHSKELAQERGFKQIRSVCTNAYTAKMFARSGFECVYALQYTDCAKQGIIKYLPQEPHTHIKGMVLKC